MLDSKNYDKIDIYEYQHLMNKLMYLLYKIKPDIIFTVS